MFVYTFTVCSPMIVYSIMQISIHVEHQVELSSRLTFLSIKTSFFSRRFLCFDFPPGFQGFYSSGSKSI